MIVLRVIASVVLLLPLLAPAGLAAVFVHGPYAGAPSGDSVTISWTSDVSVAARVEYGERADAVETQTFTASLDVPASLDEPPVDTTHVLLSGLRAATRYAYRVVLLDDSQEIASPTGYFATEPNAREPVTFAVLADTQQQLDGVNRLALVAQAIAADPSDLDFILHGGDVIEAPSALYWDHWFASFEDMLLRAPLLPVLGNHESNDRSYYDAFQLPPGAGEEGERWWAFDWGDLVVVGLDTNANKLYEIREQQAWAAQHLSGSQTHKFVIFHHPAFVSGSPYEESAYVFDELYHPLFVENHVDVVFNGHAHHYERIVRDGVTYLVLGGGGAQPEVTARTLVQGSDTLVEGHYFYTRVSTSPAGIAVETLSAAEEIAGTAIPTPGLVLDSFFLPTDPASPSD